MASLNGTFDATTIEPAAAFDIVPPGNYVAQIIKSGMKDTQTGGQMLEIELDIVDGEYANRKLWDRLNIVNANATAQEIAHRTLSAICHATGVLAVTDSEQLHFKPMLVTVKVRPERTDPKTGKTYQPSNEIKGYASANGASPAPAKAAFASPTAAAAPAPVTKKGPWQR